MNKKITISELSQLLSTNVSLINKKGWEDFLRIFFAQISEGLQADGNVKIKGLGTFKVVKVDARKSKDVNTGANTIIPAHNKISFTPDSSLAETLNKPYAHFEPTYVLAPEGEVDAPEPEEDDDTEVNNVKAETTETATSVETVVEEPAVAATISNLNTEVVNQAANEIEAVVSETITKAETPIVETVVESPNTVAEPVETIIHEEQKVETEPTSTIGYTATSSINEEIHTEEPAAIVENEATSSINEEIHTQEPTATVETATSSINEEIHTQEPTATAETATSSINEEIHTQEPTATAETATSSKADDIEAEGPEEPTEEDATADEDENVDTNPAEIAAYASTFKRHDLPKEDDDDENNDKNSHGKKLGIAIILFLCILFVVGLVAWMSDPNIVSKIRSKITGEEPVKTEIKVDSVDYEETNDLEEQIIAEKAEENAETMDSLIESTTSIEEPQEAKPTAKQDVQKYTNFKDDFINYMKKKHPEMDITDQGDPIEEKLGNASRLTLVSLRHYGAKDFWVYIYLYNKDVIKNPNHIKAGTKIKVPMLDNTKLVNPDSEHSILTAKEIQHEFVK
ncbi:MAG: hypothetical protein E7077_00525 [Bacteroidales bacterium]|jgi:nucleoid DNA-binding protein|nr:hypothetical protein [Bacteroidales bacterium]